MINKCVSCGSDQLEVGTVLDSCGQEPRLSFELNYIKRLLLTKGSVKISGCICRHCGFINLFADIEKVKAILP